MRVLPKMSLRKRNYWIGLADQVVCLAAGLSVLTAYCMFYKYEALEYMARLSSFRHIVGGTREVNSLDSNAIGAVVIVTLIAALTVKWMGKRHEAFVDELNKECSMEDEKKES